MNPSSLSANARRLGRKYAVAHGERLYAAFADTLEGDIARLRMRRELRRLFPGASSESIERVIWEDLTP
jgi:hypothetical protein